MDAESNAFVGIISADIAILLFTMINVYFIYRDQGAIQGWTRIFAIAIPVFLAIFVIISMAIVALPDTTDEDTIMFSSLGIVFPFFFIVIYGIIWWLGYRKSSGGSSGSSPSTPSQVVVPAANIPKPAPAKGGGSKKRRPSRRSGK